LRNVGLSLGGRIADILLPLTDKQELDNIADKELDPLAPSPVVVKTMPQVGPQNLMVQPPISVSKETNELIQASKRFRVGYCDTIGRRPTMEDQIVILGSMGGESNEDYFAVFDGHGGSAASKYSGHHLHQILNKISHENPLNSEEISHKMPSLLKESFHRCNAGLKSLGVCQETGSTAVVAYCRGSNLWVANAGDSRAVISKNGKAIRVTTDHKPTLDSERDRILNLKGYVIFGRVNGVLAVSRALGDFYFHPHVTCDPEIFGPYDVYNDEYQFMILACDGLWDVVDDNKAVQIILESKDPEEGAKKLVTTALQLLSTDNISVVVVFFPNYRVKE